MQRLNQLREAIRQPLPLAYHPLYRFYEGGSLTRQFRGLPDRPDDWWSEDWVGSCTTANNCDPDGREQGLSSVDLLGIGNGDEQQQLAAVARGDQAFLVSGQVRVIRIFNEVQHL